MPTLVFDFDSTLVSIEGLDELFDRSLEKAPDREARVSGFREITDLGMDGKLAPEESLRRRLDILEADRDLVGSVATTIAQHITPSVHRHVDFFRQNSERIYVLSGGFEELIRPALARIQIRASHLFAHRFEFDSTGKVHGLDPETPMAIGGKPAALESMGLDDGPVWVVGDGATDLELRTLGLADCFVAFVENRDRPAVSTKADAVVRSMDELLVLLDQGGARMDSFARLV